MVGKMKKRNNNGITLISLVITIVIMLILAAVTINMVIGENGIFSKAKASSTTYKKEQAKEKLQLATTNAYTNANDGETTPTEVAGAMSEELPEIEWVDTDSLSGHYYGYDFSVVNREIAMDTINVAKTTTMVNGSDLNQNDVEKTKFWKYLANIKKIDIKIDSEGNLQDKYTTNAVLNEDEGKNANVPWDLSDTNVDGVSQNSVLAYLEELPGDTSNYKLTIVGDSIINLPEDSTCFFAFLTNLDTINGIENLRYTKVKNASYMFYEFGMNGLTEFNLGPNFNPSNIENMEAMFGETGKNEMTKINLGPNFTLPNAVNLYGLFYHCGENKLETLVLGDNVNAKSAKDTSLMFYYCGYKSLKELNLGKNFNAIAAENMYYMFGLCGHEKMTKLDLGDNFGGDSATNMSWMFDQCGYNEMSECNLNSLRATSATNAGCMFSWFGRYKLKSFQLGDNFGGHNIIDMNNMFSSLGYDSLDFTNLYLNIDTSSATNMSCMFTSLGKKGLQHFKLGPKFNPFNVQTMDTMFRCTGYDNLIEFDLGENFDTQNVTNMHGMFYELGAKKLERLDLGDKFDTSKVTDFGTMFLNCGLYSLNEINLGNKFDTSSATNITSMFAQFANSAPLTKLDLGNKFVIPESMDPAKQTGWFNITATNKFTIYCLDSQVDRIKTATGNKINVEAGTYNN